LGQQALDALGIAGANVALQEGEGFNIYDLKRINKL